MYLRIAIIAALTVALAACTQPAGNVVGDVTVTPTSATIAIGATVTLDAEVEVVSGAPATTVVWSSSDTSIATVGAGSGVVTGVAVGTATITATSTVDSDASGSATITVVEPDPASIAETATAAGFSTLVAALVEADLAELFADDDAGPFTVFAPTDAAFEALLTILDAEPADLLARADLADILQYHVVAGGFLAADILDLIDAGGGTALIETLTGDDLVVTLDDGNVILNGSITVGPVDIIATNGVIHVIDGVLTVPMSFDADTDYAAFSGDADITAAPLSLSFPAFSGGLSPFSFELTAGALPADFVVDTDTFEVTLDEATGEIAGVTGFPGVFTGTVTVTDAVGASLDADFTLDLDLAFRLTAADLETTASTFTYPDPWDDTAEDPFFIVPGDRVRVSGVSDTALLPAGFLANLSFSLTYVSSDDTYTPDFGDGDSTGTFRINTGDGTIGQYEDHGDNTTWSYTVTVTYNAASGPVSVNYPVTFNQE